MRKSRVLGVYRFFVLLKEKRLTTVAAAWVFYFLVALIPIVFIMITAFNVLGMNLSSSLQTVIPSPMASFVQTVIETVENAGKGITFFFIVSVLFSTSSLLNQMSKDGDSIYDVKRSAKRGIIRRVWTIFGLCILFAIFLATAMLFSFGNKILSLTKNSTFNSLVFKIFIILVTVSVSYLIIMLLHKFISPFKLKLKTTLLGALVSLTVIIIGTMGLTIYLSIFDKYTTFYGSLASVFIFILWLYILMLGLVMGVIINMKMRSRAIRKANKKSKAQSQVVN